MYRTWLFIRQVCKDIFWLCVGLAVLFFLFVIARDVWYRANPGMNRVVPEIKAYGGIINYFKEVGK